MKRYTYTITLGVSLLLAACGESKKEKAASQARIDSLSQPQNVKIVAALAKVEPANGFIEFSSEVSGIVIESYKKEGDRVNIGESIFKLDKESENLQVISAQQAIITQQARIDGNRFDIQQYEVSLKEKEEDLTVTKRLAAIGADTRQNVAIKQKEMEVILANLKSERAKLQVELSELTVFKTKLELAEVNAKNRIIKAKKGGILVSLDTKVGTAINAFKPFALIAPDEVLVLHGEIDEMFADRVKIGQAVAVNYVGDNNIITMGKVIYLSPMLENKSLFYEKTGETSDRRVRQFKASLAKPTSLLINSRVECVIKLQ